MQTPLTHPNRSSLPHLTGVCYYPELTPDRVEDHLRMIADVGLQAVRIGEGAWAYFEPRPGVLRFDLFDEVLQRCETHGLKVVFGTPTYAAPAWVAHEHPDTLRHDFHRRPLAHGSRRIYTYNSPTYRDLARRITSAVAERFAQHPTVVAWQIDNEFHCHSDTSYAPADTHAFRAWLQDRYGSIECLNQSWGTRFWSQRYDAWEQIDLPAPTAAPQNPHQLLDEKRFLSDGVIRFLNEQIAEIRRSHPGAVVTHNALFENIDGAALSRPLNFFSHDHYPTFASDWHGPASALRQARSLSMPFAILEQQVSSIGQLDYEHRAPMPGQIELWAWQSVAHGARSIFFFPFQTFAFGAEQLCRGLIEHDERPGQAFDEVERFCAAFRQLTPQTLDARSAARIVLLRDYDSECERKIHRPHDATAPRSAWSTAADRLHLQMDEVWSGEDATRYDLLIVPSLPIASDKLIKTIEEAVKAGRGIVFTAGTLSKTLQAHLCDAQQRRSVESIVGAACGWRTALPPGERHGVRLNGVRIDFICEATQLIPCGAEIVTAWDASAGAPLAGSAAMTRFGNVICLGGTPDAKAAEAVLNYCAATVGIRSPIGAPPDVEMVERVDADNARSLFVLNHAAQAVSIDLRDEWQYDGKSVRSLILSAYGSAMLQRPSTDRPAAR